jgi:hypothetical protein
LFSLGIETSRAVLARDLGLIFDRLGNAFEQFQRSNPTGLPRAQLRLQDLQFGSVYADLLAFAGTVVTLTDFWGVASEFMQRLSGSLNLLMNHEGKQVPPADRTLIQALNAPVATDGARQVSLNLHGDNANVIIINAENSPALTEYFRSIAPAGGSGGSRYLPYLDHPSTEKASAAAHEFQRRQREQPIELPQPLPPAPSEKMATLLPINGAWMARVEGFGGALFPINLLGGIEHALGPPEDAEEELIAHGRMEANRFVVHSFVERNRDGEHRPPR